MLVIHETLISGLTCTDEAILKGWGYSLLLEELRPGTEDRWHDERPVEEVVPVLAARLGDEETPVAGGTREEALFLAITAAGEDLVGLQVVISVDEGVEIMVFA